MRALFIMLIISVAILTMALNGTSSDSASGSALLRQEDNHCNSCHGGIEHIRQPESGMMQAILELAATANIKGNDCVVCHGGDPSATDVIHAHQGSIAYFEKNPGPKEFYPDPGSPWINQNTCGVCHDEQVRTQFTSLMFTEAGKIQGTLWGFGGINGYEHDIGNYKVKELEAHEKLGSETYRKYMEQLKEDVPQVFPVEMSALPPAPTAEQVEANPQLAVYTYLRQECQRCHTGNKGRSKRGDFRGIGCSSCHMPYSNEGYYEGNDPTIDPEEKGHMLVHSIQSTRDATVVVHDKEYSGIPVETCTTCHDRGKRIGTSYQGLMETAYSSPFMGDGEEQLGLHSKKYIHLHADVHLDKGMLCQDCHTSADAHSDGTLSGTTLAPVEIECQDCHGTPFSYPWELPIGYGDEVIEWDHKGARGLSDTLLAHMKKGTIYPKRDGYLISARGNPIGNVVRDGNGVVVHTAGGKDLELEPLKKLSDENKLSDEGRVAMVNVEKHMDKMECYACHSDWAPQCYGCHIKVDYSTEEMFPDWVAIGNDHDESGLTAEARGKIKDYLIEGKVSEQRSYLRWEDPPLAINGENRVSPAIPGCQTTVTVIGKDGDPLLLNHIFRIPNDEGAGAEGQLGIDISPVQPHTTSKSARSCESCHANPKALGYGIKSGEIYEPPNVPYVAELSSADGEVLSERGQTQISAIPNLTMDWSRFVTEEGQQLQTVGHHFPNSRPLNNEERANIDRQGVCQSCHQSIPEKDLAISLLSHVKEVTGKKIDKEDHEKLLNKNIRLAAWMQVLIAGILVVGLVVFAFMRIRR